MRDRIVHAAVPLAVRDHEGDGPPVLMLHGAGGNLLQWEGIAGVLGSSYRVFTVDLRGHGHSGDGPWEWDAVLDDLEAVAGFCGLDNPAVVGHSLGGMLAGMWARRHPECPAAISLDGHRSAVTHERNYAAMPLEEVRRDLTELKALFEAEMVPAPMTHGRVEALLNRQRTVARRGGLDERTCVAELVRNFIVHNGHVWARPGGAITSALRDAAEFADCLPVFQEVTVPFLIVLATHLPGAPPEFSALMTAHRAGLRRDLAELVRRRPNVTVYEIAAGHRMVAEQPRRVAAVIADYLAWQAV